MGAFQELARDIATELEDFEGFERDLPVIGRAESARAHFSRGYAHLQGDDFAEVYVFAAMGSDLSRRFRAMEPEHRARVQRIHNVGMRAVTTIKSLEVMLPLTLLAPVMYGDVLRQVVPL